MKKILINIVIVLAIIASFVYGGRIYKNLKYKYYDNYDYNKPYVKNQTHVDPELYETCATIYCEYMMYNLDTAYLDYKKLYNIEDISYEDDVDMLPKNVGATTIFWRDTLGNLRTRIIVNSYLRYAEEYVIYFVIQHEIAHGAFHIDHYDDEVDLMNSYYSDLDETECRELIYKYYTKPSRYKILQYKIYNNEIAR